MMRHLITVALGATIAVMFGCGPSYPKCDTDEICQSHREYCVNGQCRQCRDDSHCSAFGACGVCDNNSCSKRQNCCTSDLDCPRGRCWMEPGKNYGWCGKQCKTNADCPPGQRCNAEGMCEPDWECDPPSIPCPAGKVCENHRCVAQCTAENIYFDYNEHKLTSDAKATLQKNADCVKAQNKSVRIEGHCDERGDAEYNLALGERRANAAKDFLKNLGINIGKAISYGKERPTCTESNEGCWSKNRRDEFHFE